MSAPVVDVLGTAVRLVAPRQFHGDTAQIASRLPYAHGEAPRELRLEPTDDRRLRLLEEGEVLLDPVPPGRHAAALVWRLNAIATRSSSHLVLHAGCVSTENRGVVLPAPSGAGKSMLVASCVRDGFGYLSDEHAALDLDGGILTPLPKPLDLGGPQLVDASELGPGLIGAPCPPAAVVFPRYQRGGTRIWRQLDPAAALVGLCANTVNLAAIGRQGFLWLAGLAERCPASQVAYPDGVDALEAVRSAAADHEAPAPMSPAQEVGPVTPTTATVIVGGQVVVYDTRTKALHHLNDSAGFVWLCVADATGPRSLAELVVAETPTGAIDRAHVDATAEHLTGLGLLPW